ncbi:Lacal_2735 family protein [uncultured Psychroserpens sp.]|uniref:Lacal_2735 family protein n=1 Tax=uncultured Psychroserpens sp. TaxID=255436 RepID=UPI002602F61D|nr:Lacal_2735 family protein [uncultured Psychroserpens sp.]
MSRHFCRIGHVSLSHKSLLNLGELEHKYYHFIEEAYNVMQTDASLSDFLYHEASKIKKRIRNLKTSKAKGRHVKF